MDNRKQSIPSRDCGPGYVIDCADLDCCPESWIGDGYEDCEDQAYGCDLTCNDNDGGDCGCAYSHGSGPKVQQLPNHSFIMIDEVGNMDNSEFSRELEGYFIYRGLTSGGTNTQVDYVDVGITSYTDEGLVNGTEYFYVVTAYDNPAAHGKPEFLHIESLHIEISTDTFPPHFSIANPS